MLVNRDSQQAALTQEAMEFSQYDSEIFQVVKGFIEHNRIKHLIWLPFFGAGADKAQLWKPTFGSFYGFRPGINPKVARLPKQIL